MSMMHQLLGQCKVATNTECYNSEFKFEHVMRRLKTRPSFNIANNSTEQNRKFICHISEITDKYTHSSRGVLGGICGYMAYTNLLCFLTAYTYLICHNKTGYVGIYALTVNRRMCTAPCHTILLNFFPCTFYSTCNM